jgi:hypothetical protein
MNNIIKVRLLLWCSLIFSFTTIACRQQEKAKEEILLVDEGRHIKKILIPLQMLSTKSFEEAKANLRVVLAKPGAPPILGDYTLLKNYVVFEAAIPFTPHLRYEIYYKDRKLKYFVIPASEVAPVITAIYPNEDSLPENLLKIYISFSDYMQEGVAAQHVALVKDGKDTLSNVFLDLQPELWNGDRTTLTLWLNPGRTKSDLIPNRQEGPNLEAGAHYEILVKPGWRNEFGDSITTAFSKKFVTVSRDMISPDINTWKIQAPPAGTKQPLTIGFKEPMDYMVIKNSIFVTDENYNVIEGDVEVTDNERLWHFVPNEKWKKGSYRIDIEPRAEDLAGNNLERLFEKDLAKPGPEPSQRVSVVRTKEFKVR